MEKAQESEKGKNKEMIPTRNEEDISLRQNGDSEGEREMGGRRMGKGGVARKEKEEEGEEKKERGRFLSLSLSLSLPPQTWLSREKI